MSNVSWGLLCRHIAPMHEVVPKVVAMAVKMVMTKCSILGGGTDYTVFSDEFLIIRYRNRPLVNAKSGCLDDTESVANLHHFISQRLWKQ